MSHRKTCSASSMSARPQEMRRRLGLRIGFVVFDYWCVQQHRRAGPAPSGRETESGQVVVGSDGPTSLAGDVDPPDALDVLITSGGL